MSKTCPKCGKDNPDNYNFCAFDGQSLTIDCPNCSAKNPVGAAYCRKCYHSMDEAEPAAPTPPPPPEERYEIVSKIIRLETHQTSLAHDREEADREVIYKEFDTKKNKSLAGDFETEQARLSKLKVKGFVGVSDILKSRGVVATVRDYVSGKNLSEYIREEGRLSGERLKLFVYDLSTTLGDLNKEGIVHGNVKPSNVIIDEKALERGSNKRPFVSLTDPALLSASRDVYPPQYLAPELRPGDLVPTRDLYAFGILLIYAATGSEVSAADLANYRGFINGLDLGIGLRPIVEKLIDPNPEKRFASFDDAAERFIATESLWAGDREGQAEEWKYYRGGFLNVRIKKINAAALSPNGRLISLSDADGTIYTWHVPSGAYYAGLKGHPSEVRTLAFSRNGNLVASGGDDATINIWLSSKDQGPLQTIKGHVGGINCLSFTPDERLLVSGGDDKTIKVWRVDSGEEVADLTEHKDGVISVAVSPDGSSFASTAYDRTIKIWEETKKESLLTIPSDIGTIMALSYSPDGRYIIGGSKDGFIGIWKATDGSRVEKLKNHDNLISSLAVDPVNGLIVSSGLDDRVILRRLDTMDVLNEIGRQREKDSSGIIYVTFSPDGKYVVFCEEQKGVYAWRISSQFVEKILGPS